MKDYCKVCGEEIVNGITVVKFDSKPECYHILCARDMMRALKEEGKLGVKQLSVLQQLELWALAEEKEGGTKNERING